MPTYDVTFKVEYMRTVRVEEPDEDAACETAGDEVHGELLGTVHKLDVSLYSCEIARKDDDA